MSDLIKIKRGTLKQIKDHVPGEGEPVWATDQKRLYVGDGTTPGGYPIGPYLEKPMAMYVTPTGNPTSSGFSWSEATTLTTAWNRAKSYNWRQLGDMTIYVGTGSYTLTQSLSGWTACPPLDVIGDIDNPSNVTITTTYSHSYGGTFQSSAGSVLKVQGMTLDTTAANDANNQQRALVAWSNGMLYAVNVNFTGNWETMFTSVESGLLNQWGNSTISGVSRNAIYYADGTSAIVVQPGTTSFVSNPTIKSINSAVGSSTIWYDGVRQYTGAATVTYKHNAYGFSSIQLNGTTISYGANNMGSNINGVF